LDLGVTLPGSKLAKVRAPELSSWTTVLMLVVISEDIPIAEATAVNKVQKGSSSRIAMESALYSVSIVDKAIRGMSFDCHMTGQLDMQIAKPARDLTQTGSSGFS
jgi:hypothetical protein